eukprot:PhM_4_TR14043/c0_g1_i1/m.6321
MRLLYCPPRRVVICLCVLLAAQFALYGYLTYVTSQHDQELRHKKNFPKIQTVLHVVSPPKTSLFRARASVLLENVVGLADALQREQIGQNVILVPSSTDSASLAVRPLHASVQWRPLGDDRHAEDDLLFCKNVFHFIQANGANVSIVHIHGARAAPVLELLRQGVGVDGTATAALRHINYVYNVHDIEDETLSDVVTKERMIEVFGTSSSSVWTSVAKGMFQKSHISSELPVGRLQRIGLAFADVIVYPSRVLAMELKDEEKRAKDHVLARVWGSLCDATAPIGADVCDRDIQLRFLRRINGITTGIDLHRGLSPFTTVGRSKLVFPSKQALHRCFSLRAESKRKREERVKKTKVPFSIAECSIQAVKSAAVARLVELGHLTDAQGSRPIILFRASLSRRHGAHLCYELADVLRMEEKEEVSQQGATLILYGSHGDVDFTGLTMKDNVTSIVAITPKPGDRELLSILMLAAAFSFLPSRHEPHNVAAAEALLFAQTPITTALGVTRDFLFPYGVTPFPNFNSFVFEVDDVPHLKRTVDRALQWWHSNSTLSKDVLQKLVPEDTVTDRHREWNAQLNNRIQIGRDHTWDNIYISYQRFYESLVVRKVE